MKTLPKNLLLLKIEIPSTLQMETVRQPPLDVRLSQQIDEEWLKDNRKPILSVPSVIAPLQRNYILNPAHQLFKAIAITEETPFVFDSRLIGHLSEALVEPESPASD